MPSISTPRKIEGTRRFTENVIFSGSRSEERERKVEEVRRRTGAVLVPPYDHKDVVLGQGTVGWEMEGQIEEMLGWERGRAAGENGRGLGRERGCSEALGTGNGVMDGVAEDEDQDENRPHLHAVIAPCGGGGLLSGIAAAFSYDEEDGSGHSGNDDNHNDQHKTQSQKRKTRKTLVFGVEPTFQGADDCSRALRSLYPHLYPEDSLSHPTSTTTPTAKPEPPTPSSSEITAARIPHVSTLTIADGVRTPVGHIPWSIISQPQLVAGVYAISEVDIKRAMKVLLEELGAWVEPSGALGLGVVMRSRGWRGRVGRLQRESGEEVWNVGVVISGGNTTVEAVAELFKPGWDVEEGEEGIRGEEERQRETGELGIDGAKTAEDVPG